MCNVIFIFAFIFISLPIFALVQNNKIQSCFIKTPIAHRNESTRTKQNIIAKQIVMSALSLFKSFDQHIKMLCIRFIDFNMRIRCLAISQHKPQTIWLPSALLRNSEYSECCWIHSILWRQNKIIFNCHYFAERNDYSTCHLIKFLYLFRRNKRRKCACLMCICSCPHTFFPCGQTDSQELITALWFGSIHFYINFIVLRVIFAAIK